MLLIILTSTQSTARWLILIICCKKPIRGTCISSLISSSTILQTRINGFRNQDPPVIIPIAIGTSGGTPPKGRSNLITGNPSLEAPAGNSTKRPANTIFTCLSKNNLTSIGVTLKSIKKCWKYSNSGSNVAWTVFAWMSSTNTTKTINSATIHQSLAFAPLTGNSTFMMPADPRCSRH